jgi:predicted PurR-regulated permease PerM
LNNSNSDLPTKIKAILFLYLKTQFVLVLITVASVWGIMIAVPEIHPVYEALIAILSYIVLSQIMDYFISPYLIGKKVKISPIFLVVSFVLGVSFMGLIGAFFAIPIALVLKTIWEHYSTK